ncbi:MAG: hypothetical protein IJO22_01385 [Oscillospiraceae bacterium]|nr:hypothetical protein [Oscillospiraceae bacterium]
MTKRIVSLFFAVLMIAMSSVGAFAHDVPDPDKKGSITIKMEYRDKAVPGGTLTIYKVADVAEKDGDYFYTYTEDFKDCSVPLSEIGSSELANALARIAIEKRLAGRTERINHLGEVKFDNLEIGLYLVIQKESALGFNNVNPFLVSVPAYEDGKYIYDVNASPKVELEPDEPKKPDEPEKPEKPEKPDDKLPDTGLTNWPVPVMAVSGAVLLCVGIILHSAERKMK